MDVKSSSIFEAAVVLKSFVTMLSLIATGIPSNTFAESTPRSSIACASFSAISLSEEINAPTCPSTSFIRSNVASTSSTTVSSLFTSSSCNSSIDFVCKLIKLHPLHHLKLLVLRSIVQHVLVLLQEVFGLLHHF